LILKEVANDLISDVQESKQATYKAITLLREVEHIDLETKRILQSKLYAVMEILDQAERLVVNERHI